jgi:hypothetical protein
MAIQDRMLWRSVRPRLAGFIEPCLPSPAPNPPSGMAGFTRSSWTASACSRGVMLSACGSLPAAGMIGPRATRQSLPPWLRSPAGHAFVPEVA